MQSRAGRLEPIAAVIAGFDRNESMLFEKGLERFGEP
jgi:hypothetical protein